MDALRHQIGNPDSPLERWLLETSPLQRWLLETDLTPWQRCLLHDIIAGQSLKADSPKIALTSRYATPNFPSNPTLPDSSGSQEFFLGDSENFGGASW